MFGQYVYIYIYDMLKCHMYNLSLRGNCVTIQRIDDGILILVHFLKNMSL